MLNKSNFACNLEDYGCKGSAFFAPTKFSSTFFSCRALKRQGIYFVYKFLKIFLSAEKLKERPKTADTLMKTRGSSIRARVYGCCLVFGGTGGRPHIPHAPHRPEDGQPPERGAGFFSRYGVQSGGGGGGNQLFRGCIGKNTKLPERWSSGQFIGIFDYFLFFILHSSFFTYIYKGTRACVHTIYNGEILWEFLKSSARNSQFLWDLI